MKNRIDQVLEQQETNQVLDAIATAKGLLPFLIKLSDADRTVLQMLDDGRKPFTQKALELALRNAPINPGTEMVEAATRDYNLYSGLSTIEQGIMQMLEMVRDTKQLAGAEAYEVARFVYKKAKFALETGEPGMKSIVDELGKLYKQAPGTNTPEEK